MPPGLSHILRGVGVLWLCCFGGRAFAADYYLNDASTTGDVAFPGCAVMGTGSNTAGCGSCSAPCRGLQYAYDNLALTAGDTVFLNTGTYTSGSTAPILETNDPSKAGTATNMLTFRGPLGADGRAAVNGSQVPLALLDGGGTAYAGVFLRVPGIRLQGLGVTNLTSLGCAGSLGLCGSAVRALDSDLVDSLEVTGLRVYGLPSTGGNAVDIDQPPTVCSHCVIDNNDFRTTLPVAAGLYFQGLGGLVIRGNHIDGWGDEASAYSPSIVLFGTGAAGAVIENNVITNADGNAISILSCDNSMACDGTNSTNVLVRSNTFRNTVRLGGNGTVTVYPGSSASLANNIFQQSTGRAIFIQSPPLTSDYNLFHLTGTAQLARIESTTTNYATLAAWQGTSRDLNSLAADPLFVSATDSHLQSPTGHTTPLAPTARTQRCPPRWTVGIPHPSSPENAHPTVAAWIWVPTATHDKTR